MMMRRKQKIRIWMSTFLKSTNKLEIFFSYLPYWLIITYCLIVLFIYLFEFQLLNYIFEYKYIKYTSRLIDEIYIVYIRKR